jgi:hypothetical protein
LDKISFVGEERHVIARSRKWQLLYNASLTLALLAIPSILSAQAGPVIDVGRFSNAVVGNGLPAGWKPLTFKKIKKHTVYSLVNDGDTVVVKAVSDSSASGLLREIKIDPQEYPVLQWRWKVSNILKKGDVYQKDGDDYPARLYITFEYDPSKLSFSERLKYEAARLFYGEYPPLAAINYIWESHAPIGTMVPNPFTDRVMMFVVESGAEKLNQWVDEERNVYEDYQRAFGEKPPLISGVAIMTDTDNTGESATAYYGDILFQKASRGR